MDITIIIKIPLDFHQTASAILGGSTQKQVTLLAYTQVSVAKIAA